MEKQAIITAKLQLVAQAQQSQQHQIAQSLMLPPQVFVPQPQPQLSSQPGTQPLTLQQQQQLQQMQLQQHQLLQQQGLVSGFANSPQRPSFSGNPPSPIHNNLSSHSFNS